MTFFAFAAACSDEDAGDASSTAETSPGCLEQAQRVVLASCTPAYQPTFHNVLVNTLQPRCNESRCHGASSGAGDLTLAADAEVVFAELTKWRPDGPLVVPGRAECSPLTLRLESPDPAFVMPRFSSLSLGERCAISQWIAAGASPL